MRFAFCHSSDPFLTPFSFRSIRSVLISRFILNLREAYLKDGSDHYLPSRGSTIKFVVGNVGAPLTSHQDISTRYGVSLRSPFRDTPQTSNDPFAEDLIESLRIHGSPTTDVRAPENMDNHRDADGAIPFAIEDTSVSMILGTVG